MTPSTEPIWLVLTTAIATSLITAPVTIAVTWLAPSRQHRFWARQQGLTLFLESYKRFVAFANEYEDTLVRTNAVANPQLTKQLLSITQEIQTFFPPKSATWKAFVALDEVINRLQPAYSAFIQARVQVQREILAKMGFLF